MINKVIEKYLELLKNEIEEMLDINVKTYYYNEDINGSIRLYDMYNYKDIDYDKIKSFPLIILFQRGDLEIADNRRNIRNELLIDNNNHFIVNDFRFIAMNLKINFIINDVNILDFIENYLITNNSINQPKSFEFNIKYEIEEKTSELKLKWIYHIENINQPEIVDFRTAGNLWSLETDLKLQGPLLSYTSKFYPKLFTTIININNDNSEIFKHKNKKSKNESKS